MKWKDATALGAWLVKARWQSGSATAELHALGATSPPENAAVSCISLCQSSDEEHNVAVFA